jgi:hypothetical protein
MDNILRIKHPMELEQPLEPVNPLDALFIGKTDFAVYEGFSFFAETRTFPLELAFGAKRGKMGKKNSSHRVHREH